MSWECHCPGAVERGAEHRPGAHVVCPYCARTREHAELLQLVGGLADTFASGDADKDTLPSYLERFRSAGRIYRMGAAALIFDETTPAAQAAHTADTAAPDRGARPLSTWRRSSR